MRNGGEIHPLEMLTAALGGRRIYALLWIVWFFATTVGYYLQMMPRGGENQKGTVATFTLCVVGLVVFGFLLARGLLSESTRRALLVRQTNLPPARPTFRILVLAVPILALVMVLVPVVSE